jgi:hypothetical protein
MHRPSAHIAAQCDVVRYRDLPLVAHPYSDERALSERHSRRYRLHFDPSVDQLSDVSTRYEERRACVRGLPNVMGFAELLTLPSAGALSL